MSAGFPPQAWILASRVSGVVIYRFLSCAPSRNDGFHPVARWLGSGGRNTLLPAHGRFDLVEREQVNALDVQVCRHQVGAYVGEQLLRGIMAAQDEVADDPVLFGQEAYGLSDTDPHRQFGELGGAQGGGQSYAQ